MSMQIVYAKVVGKEVVFDDDNLGVNLTEWLKGICYNNFVDKPYQEDGEKIFYKTMDYKKTIKFLKQLVEIEDKIWEELKTVKGNSLREEKMTQFRDCSLVKNQIVGMLLQNCDEKYKILALI